MKKLIKVFVGILLLTLCFTIFAPLTFADVDVPEIPNTEGMNVDDANALIENYNSEVDIYNSQVQEEYENREDKPWGYEKVLIYTEKYLTKELFIKEGYQTSFHYHPNKDETMYIVSGKGYIEFEDSKEYFGAKDTVRIEPNTPHTIVAIENTVLHEVSTPDLDDTVRIKDYYDSQTPSGNR